MFQVIANWSQFLSNQFLNKIVDIYTIYAELCNTRKYLINCVILGSVLGADT